MLQLGNKYVQVGPTSRDANSVPQLDLMALLRIILRRWRSVAAIVVLGLLLGGLYTVIATRQYSAEFSILLDPTKSAATFGDGNASARAVDPGQIESQVEVINSDSVALMVVRTLDLTHDAKFMHQKPSVLQSLVIAIRSSVNHLFNRQVSAPPSDEDLEKQAVAIITKSTKVTRVGISYVLEVEYTGTDAYETARIANAISDAYMDSKLQARYDASRRTTTWLQDRLKLLRDETTKAEAAVQLYKVQNNIVDTARGLMSDQQLADANTQLSNARKETASLKARLDRVEDVMKNTDLVNSTAPGELNDDILNRLRNQYLDLAAREHDLESRFGKTHLAVVNLNSQMAEILNAAKGELGRVAQSARSDYTVAVSNEQAVQQNLKELIAQTDTSNEAQVQLRNLESQAQTSRTLYDNMLQKMQETTQEQSSPDESARVISPAMLPDGASSPKKPLILGASFLGSLVFGCLLAIAREMTNNTFKTPEDVRSYAGLECLGTLPVVALTRAAKRRVRKSGPSENEELAIHSPVARQTLLAPFSRFSETIRNVKVSIDVHRQGVGGAVIGIVSSVPKEGKTTFSSNLAFLTAQMGHRTLIIDADLHNPSLTRTFLGGQIGTGLSDVLEGHALFSDTVITSPGSGLDFLASGIKERKANSVSLLTSEVMENLLATLRQQYEYIFIDFPPIVPVVDVKATAHLVDNFVFVVEWGSTSRDVVYDALISSDQVREKTIGIILNKADPLELKRLESYRGPAYGSYYLETES